jgi:hypothetical protein
MIEPLVVPALARLHSSVISKDTRLIGYTHQKYLNLSQRKLRKLDCALRFVESHGHYVRVS